MSKLSLDRFLALLERSKLVEGQTLAAAVEDWKRRATLAELDDATPCAEYLIDIGLLTRWQARKLIEGRHRGFYLGNYKLLDHLGTGGMSSVYLAEHVRLRRRAAIKILPHRRANDRTYLDRFQVEGRAIAALDHPNIVRVYDLDDVDTLHFLVMEYIEGRDLAHIVEEEGPLDFHTAAEFCAQAAEGLAHAHAAGLIHRDIKPANLLLDLKDTVKILDMGLAKFTSDDRDTQAEQVVGTADYLAPEQARNSHAVDHRADIYALGCTLYFLLSGHPPFPKGTSVERVSAHLQEEPPSLLVDRADTPEALVAICRRMMEKSPEARYQTADEVRAALADWLAAEAVAGRRRMSSLARTAGSHGSSTRRARHTESHINLISGSAPDLRGSLSEPSNLASPLTDTDANLTRATLPIDPAQVRLAGTAANQPSGVTPPEHPTPPPVPIPPTSAMRVVPLSDSAPSSGPDIEPVLAPALDDNYVLRMHRRGRLRGRAWWTIACTALLAGALVWTLISLAN